MKSQIAKIMDAELNNERFPQETNEEFVQRVCFLYMTHLQNEKSFSSQQFLPEILEEVQHEVIEVFRMKIYGFYNIAHYRKVQNARKSG